MISDSDFAYFIRCNGTCFTMPVFPVAFCICLRNERRRPMNPILGVSCVESNQHPTSLNLSWVSVYGWDISNIMAAD